MNPLVSVAIVTYNQKIYLKECIESILIQDYDNLEIIVADDGSTDGTHEMLIEFDKKYPNKFILRLSTENKGITANCNSALLACKGKYISWIGGDDLMLPHKISKQVKFMEENPDCVISYHNFEVFDSDTDKVLYLMNNSRNSFIGNFSEVISKGVFNGACATMIKRSHAPKDGFDKRLLIASDWLFWMETLANGGSIYYIDEILGKYRRHNNNITKKTGNIGEVDLLNSCNILLIKYPQYSKQIFKRYSEICRDLRFKESENYLNWIMISFRHSFNYKAFFQILIYIFSAGKIRK